ncbi:MAG: hypothetical protein AAF236_05925 [Verrucomicrobiota bacterium]
MKSNLTLCFTSFLFLATLSADPTGQQDRTPSSNTRFLSDSTVSRRTHAWRWDGSMTWGTDENPSSGGIKPSIDIPKLLGRQVRFSDLLDITTASRPFGRFRASEHAYWAPYPGSKQHIARVWQSSKIWDVSELPMGLTIDMILFISENDDMTFFWHRPSIQDDGRLYVTRCRRSRPQGARAGTPSFHENRHQAIPNRPRHTKEQNPVSHLRQQLASNLPE